MEERRDDWRHGVDENLASLNTGQRVHERLIEDLDAGGAALDRLLRGDAENDTDGLIAKMHILETQLARLNAVVFMDAAGKHGLQHDVKELKEGREDRRSIWGNWTKVVVAAIISGLLGRMWPDIWAFMTRRSPPSKLDRLIENTKHPKNRYHNYVVPAESEEEE